MINFHANVFYPHIPASMIVTLDYIQLALEMSYGEVSISSMPGAPPERNSQWLRGGGMQLLSHWSFQLSFPQLGTFASG